MMLPGVDTDEVAVRAIVRLHLFRYRVTKHTTVLYSNRNKN